MNQDELTAEDLKLLEEVDLIYSRIEQIYRAALEHLLHLH